MEWAVTVGMMITTALSSLAGFGGVRFEADPGFCEPGDAWTVTSHSATVVRPDGSSTTRVTARKLSPLPPTCQRELGGLLPGPYRVLVTPQRRELPPYSFSFEVRARQWTDVPLRQPPVVVRGRITSNGVPVPGASLNLIPAPETARLIAPPRSEPRMFVETPSDNDGRYATVRWAPGTYAQSVLLNGQKLPGTSAEVTLGPGVTEHDVEVGTGSMRIWFTERGATLQDEITVRLTLHALPQKPFTRTLRASSTPVDIGMLAPGRYVIRATAERPDEGRVISLVSARETEVTLSVNHSADASIDLTAREGWLRVIDTEGQPIESAAVVAYPGATSLRTDEAGRVSLATLPVGARLPIRTRKWGMTCHVVTEDLEQQVTIADASESIVLRFPQGPAGARPLAAAAARELLAGSTVTGLAGAACPLPFEAFSVAEARVPGASELTVMLPAGSYTLHLRDGRTLSVRAPGSVEIKK